MTKLATRISIFALALCLLAIPATAQNVADVQLDSAGVYFQPQVAYGQLTLDVSGPRDYYSTTTFGQDEAPAFDLATGMTDGTYSYELRVIPAINQDVKDLLINARATGDVSVERQLIDAGELPETTLVQSGSFTVAGGSLVNDGLIEGVETKMIPTKATVLATNDGVIRFSLCVGGDCPNSPSFGSDTVRIQENNTRLHFDDTSASASFPNNDWRLTANDSTNGGDNYFSIDDATANRQLFRVDAGAPANSLRVSSAGSLGVGTGSPNAQIKIHTVFGNTPTLRLEQDGSNGFTPQIYDIAANETNFFIRDVTNSSRLFFRSKPGAPENSIFIAADGDVGMGTENPAQALHVTRSDAANTFMRVDNTNAGNFFAGIFLDNSAAVDEWDISVNTSGQLRLSRANSGVIELSIDDDTGNVLVARDLTVNGTFSNPSSKTLKHSFESVDSSEILERLVNLPINKWTYKSDDLNRRHIGPFTEDFQAAFGIGTQGTHIVPMDVQGVTIAAVQGLHQALVQKSAEVDALTERLEALEAALATAE